MMYQIPHPSKQDQRAVIQFLGAEGCQPGKIHQRMQAVYGNACVSKTTVTDWCRQFRQGRQSTADLARPGSARVATTPANIAAVETAIRGHRRTSIRAIAADLNISVGTVHSIIRDLGTVNNVKRKGKQNSWKCKVSKEIKIPSKAKKVTANSSEDGIYSMPLYDDPQSTVSVLSFDEVMIKNDPVDEVSTDSDCVLPEATVKHETEDPVGI